MSVAGSLQIILECDADGKFTTSIIRAGTALDDLTSKAKVTVNAVQQVESKVSSSTASFVGWTMAIGESKAALENLYDVFGKWIERIVEVNSHIEQTTALLAGFSDASTQIERLKEGVSQVNTIMTMATQTPFSFGALQDTFVKLKTAAIDPLNGSMKSLTDAVAAFGGDDSRLKRAGYARTFQAPCRLWRRLWK
jgi:phage tail tape-measure protein